VPIAIKGVPSLDLAPVINREWDPTGASVAMTPEDYFVLTRVDGKTSFKQICVIAGFPETQTMQILSKLRDAGAILLPGEPPPAQPLRTARGTQPTQVPPPADAGAHVRKRPSTSAPPPMILERRVAVSVRSILIDEAALAESCDLSLEQKRAILTKHAALSGGTLFEILDVDPDADKRTIKRSYYRISKDFHPDRFYGKKLGSFEQRLADIFKMCTEAFDLLDDDGQREAYLHRLRGDAAVAAGGPAPAPLGPQSKVHRAGELFELACQHEVTGETQQALAEFGAAVALDPQPRFLRRAAEACIRAQELRSAEEYAKKFAALSPRDAQAHRTLAKVYKALGRNQDAHTELQTATQLDPGNRHIAAELEEIQKLI
jgi:curved DNA-binding protein CbpA